MADEERQLLESARSWPLQERLECKSSWKVRAEALDFIKDSCQRARGPGDPIFSEAGGCRALRPPRCLRHAPAGLALHACSRPEFTVPACHALQARC